MFSPTSFRRAPKRQAASMAQLIGSLKSYQTDLGFSNAVFENDEQIKRILRGIKVVSGIKPKRERLPITKDIIGKLVEQCDKSFNGTVIRAAIWVAFAAFLRMGEFTYNTWNGSSHECLVSWGSIKFSCNAVTLTLPKSKTDPFAKGVQIPMPATNDPIFPREALKSLIS